MFRIIRSSIRHSTGLSSIQNSLWENAPQLQGCNHGRVLFAPETRCSHACFDAIDSRKGDNLLPLSPKMIAPLSKRAWRSKVAPTLAADCHPNMVKKLHTTGPIDTTAKMLSL